MKKSILLLIVTIVFLTSCSNSPQDKAQSSVKSYLKENFKNSGSYEPISFSVLDTLKNADTSETKQISLYEITHFYIITNADNEKVKMTITFFLDKDLKVNETNTKSINGDYGIMTGNAYWEYNDYVGDKADAGAEVILYSLDSMRGNMKYETTADLYGNYKFEKVLPGQYFLIVCSGNATDCPDSHLQNLRRYKSEIKQVFDFDINNYKTQLAEIDVLDSIYYKRQSIYYKSLIELTLNGSFSQINERFSQMTAISKERTEKIEKLFEKIPDDFKRKIGLYSGYGYAYDFSIIIIEEGKISNKVTDFGITCI